MNHSGHKPGSVRKWHQNNQDRPVLAGAKAPAILCIPGLVLAATTLLTGCSPLPLAGGDPLPAGFPFSESFETGSLSPLWYEETARADAIRVLLAPAGNPASGSLAALVEVSPADMVNHGNRAELALYGTGAYRDTLWFGFDFLVPSDDPDSYDWQILAQWYQLPDFQRGETFDLQFPHPPVTLVLVKGALKLKNNVGSEQDLAVFPIAKGKWYRVVTGITFDTGSQGMIQAEITPLDGLDPTVTAGPWSMPTLANKAGAYFKTGLYRGGYVETQATGANRVWLDNVRVSRNPVEAR